MRRRRREDEEVDSVVVITRDGTRLRCTISAIGREEEPRWMVMDSTAHQYVGPVVESDRSPEAIQRLISSWWAEQHGESAEPAPADSSESQAAK